MADFQQRANLAGDGGVFAGIIDAHLNQAERSAEDKRHQYGQTGLFERQALGERDIHRWETSRIRVPAKHSRSVLPVGRGRHTPGVNRGRTFE